MPAPQDIMQIVQSASRAYTYRYHRLLAVSEDSQSISAPSGSQWTRLFTSFREMSHTIGRSPLYVFDVLIKSALKPSAKDRVAD